MSKSQIKNKKVVEIFTNSILEQNYFFIVLKRWHLTAMGDEKFKRGKLFAAAWRGEFDGVKSIIEPRDINIDSVDENGVTALRFSAQFGHIEISR